MRKQRKIQRLNWSNIYLTIVCLAPSLWLMLGLFEEISKKTQVVATIATIPCLLIVGFVWGRDSRDKELFKFAEEADKLEEELNELKKTKEL